jgi:putative peptide zinc metalloprotease protein
MAPVVKPFFGWIGALIWLAAIIPAVILFATHWTDLTQGVLDRVLVPNNLFALWILFPVIKVFHEFGHAFATKSYGGEVHDMGIMMLVIAPVPYVDASSASAFHEKWRRVIVGAAGMLVELFIASLALFLWVNAEPGIVRSMAYNTIFIASVSTVLFNGNPLLRYDGYYILADLLEIPNLRSRSASYLLYLCERYLFGSKNAFDPARTCMVCDFRNPLVCLSHVCRRRDSDVRRAETLSRRGSARNCRFSSLAGLSSIKGVVLHPY